MATFDDIFYDAEGCQLRIIRCGERLVQIKHVIAVSKLPKKIEEVFLRINGHIQVRMSTVPQGTVHTFYSITGNTLIVIL
jgi:hypothetical protein